MFNGFAFSGMNYTGLIFFSLMLIYSVSGTKELLGESVSNQPDIEQLVEKAKSFYPSKLDSSLYYATEALSFIDNTELESSFEEEMLDLKGRIFNRMGEDQKSEDNYLASAALSLERNNRTQLSNTYNRMGLLYKRIGRFEEALNSYKKCIAIREEDQNERGLAGVLNNLGNLYLSMGNDDDAYQSYTKSIRIRENLGDERYLSSAILNMGNWMAGTGKYDSAMVYYERYKTIQEDLKDTARIAMVTTNMGNISLSQGNYEQALTNYLQSIKLAEETDKIRESSLGTDYINVSVVYIQQNYPNEAIKYLRKALRIYNRYQDPSSKGAVYHNIGRAYESLSEPDSSLYYYNEAIKEYEIINDEESLADIYDNIGVIYNDLFEHETALSFGLKSIAIHEKRGNDRNLAATYNNVGSTYYYLSDLENALKLYFKSVEKAKELKNFEYLKRALSGIAEAYGDLGQYEKAYKYHLEYVAAKDSVYDIEQSKAIEELIAKYETEQKDAEIKVLTAEQAQNEALIQQRNAENRTQLIAIFSLLAAITGIVSWFLYSARKRKIIAEQKELLFQGEIDSLMEKQQVESIGAMLEGQDKERKRLAAELHDRLGSILSLVKLYFSSMDEDIKKKQPELYDSFKEGNQFLDDAFLEVRAIIKEMTEGKVSGKGLEKDLQDLLSKISKIGIEIESKIELNKKLDSVIEMNIYRVIQEALSNSLKYSKADTIQLLISDTNELSLLVKDNGIGFDPELYRSKKESGLENYGVENMENRVKLLGGSFSLKTAKGDGVQVEVRIPIKEESEFWSLAELN